MEFEVVCVVVECFICLYLQYFNVDYVYYFKGLFFFDQDCGLLVCFLLLDMIKCDLGVVCDFFNEFVQFISCFFNSCYVLDVKVCMVYLCNLLVVYEVYVGYYYLKCQVYVVVVNCGCYVVENFQEILVVGDGLVIMVEVYCCLGFDDLVSISLEIFKFNYLDNVSFKDGEFVVCESEVDICFWLVKVILGLIEGGELLLYMEIQVVKDVIKQYEDVEWEIFVELKLENQDYSVDDEKLESDDDEDFGCFWWSYMIFGFFD